MDAPVIRNGAYYYQGMRLPRVTAILNVIAKEGVERWKRTVGEEEAQRIGDDARRLGSAVHKVCEEYVRTRRAPDGLSPELLPFISAYRQWFDRHVDEVLAIEQFVWHKTDRYGGTTDLIARLRDGRRALIDIKTSNSAAAEYRLQLTAYDEAEQSHGQPPADVRMIVRLPSRQPGICLPLEYDDPDGDRTAWAGALALYRWHEAHKHDWRGGPVTTQEVDSLLGEAS